MNTHQTPAWNATKNVVRRQKRASQTARIEEQKAEGKLSGMRPARLCWCSSMLPDAKLSLAIAISITVLFAYMLESNYGPATSRNSNLPLECSSEIRTVRDLEIFKTNRRSERGLMTHFMKAVFRPPEKRFNLIHSRLFSLAQSAMRTN